MTKINVNSEIKYFLLSLISGIILGVIYDVIRAKRKIYKSNDINVVAEDIAFCLIFALLFLFVTYYFNSGIIRFAGLFSIFLGGIIYFYLFKNKVVCFFVFSFKKIRNLILIIFKIIFFPLKVIFCLIRKPICIIFWFVNSKAKKGKTKFNIFKTRLLTKIKIFKSFLRKN